MEKIPTYSYEDAQNRKEAPEVLSVDKAVDRDEEREAIIDRIMSDEESPEETKIKTFKSKMMNIFPKGWAKIKTPKAKVQQDWEVTKAQRENPKNL